METKLKHTFGDAALILTALESMESYDPYSRELYSAVAQKLAGRELVAPGVQMAWALSVYDFCEEKGLSPLVATLLTMQFEEVATAILSDIPAFLAECIAWHKHVYG